MVTRRRLIRDTGMSAAGTLLLAGCGSSAAAGLAGQRPRDTLTYWNLFTGGDGGRMVAMEQAYAKAHPEISLSASTFTWGNPYYTKLSLATLGDRPPDVAIAHLTRAKTLDQAGLLEPFDPAELDRHGMSLDKFAPLPIQAATREGRLFAIPLDVHPLVLFYNTDICRKAGLLNADDSLVDLDSPEKFKAALTAAKKVTGQYGAVNSIINDTSTGYIVFFSLYRQLGGEFLADGGRRVVIDEARAVEVLSYLRDLSVGSGLMPTSIDYPGATVAFVQGQAAFYLEGEWEITTFLTAKMPFSMTRFPSLYGGRVVHADSHMLVIPKQPRDDPQRRDQSLRFIKGMLDESLPWAEGGHVPTWLPVTDSAAYRDLKPQSNYADALQTAGYDPDGWYAGSGSDLTNVVGAQVNAVQAGQLGPREAVAAMRSGLQKYAEMPPPLPAHLP